MLLDNFQRACQGVAAMNMGGTLVNAVSITSYPTTAAYYSNSARGWYVDVGFSDTPVEHDDYNLSDGNINGASAGLLTYVTGAVTNVLPSIRTCVTTYRNDGNSDVVVKEVGIVGKIAGSTANAPNYNHLITRKVLDTPITVPAGATMSFTYSIDLDFSENASAN